MFVCLPFRWQTKWLPKMECSRNPGVINPDEAFLITQKKEIKSEGMALARIQRDSAHTKNINIFCFHWKAEGLVLHFCLSPIQVTDKMASNMAFLQPWAYKPRCSFSNYIQKEIHSKGMALARVQRDSAHTKNINIFCFHWRVEGLVLHFCLPPIQVADKMAFSMAHKMALPTTLGL